MAATEAQPRAVQDGVLCPQENGVLTAAAAASTTAAAAAPACPVGGGGGGSPHHQGIVTKILSKRDSVRDGESKSSKKNRDKKESSAGLASSEPRHSTTSGSSDGVAKEVKFREPELQQQSGEDGDNPTTPPTAPGSPKQVPRKFISNWKHACDKTRDRTRDLLKRWRTAPEGMDVPGVHGGVDGKQAEPTQDAAKQGQGWSVHVWATWVKRLPSEEEGFPKLDEAPDSAALLTPVQRDKLSQFFTHMLDSDRDDLISKQDFENFSERLRHFADWSDNSSEYHILRELEHSFVSTFLEHESLEAGPAGERLCSLEHWLSQWGTILDEAKTFPELPVWLQFFPKVMFQVINKSGSGVVTRDELGSFYSSVLGLGAQRVGEVLDPAYKALTANGDNPLCFPAYRWCFANFLLGRHRNGPGQYLFGPGEAAELRDCPFPVDYSALNSAPEELEQYSPDRKSNRRSVVV